VAPTPRTPDKTRSRLGQRWEEWSSLAPTCNYPLQPRANRKNPCERAIRCKPLDEARARRRQADSTLGPSVWRYFARAGPAGVSRRGYRLGRIEFRITHHAGYSAPANALDLLWERLGSRYDGVSFAKGSTQIRAKWSGEPPTSMMRDEREDFGRTAVLEIVREVCERAPELKFAWYAVSMHR
jgi:hypothetical protein